MRKRTLIDKFLARYRLVRLNRKLNKVKKEIHLLERKQVGLLSVKIR
jgi:hypothetical protein